MWLSKCGYLELLSLSKGSWAKTTTGFSVNPKEGHVCPDQSQGPPVVPNPSGPCRPEPRIRGRPRAEVDDEIRLGILRGYRELR